MKKPALIAFALMLSSLDSRANDVNETETNNSQKNYYVQSVGYNSNPESDPPQYVHQLNEIGVEKFKNIDWIDVGLNYRMRFEHRKNDFRKSDDRTDNAFLSRTQAYFGIKNIIDPLRFAFEFQDSRRFNSKYPVTTGDINKLDVFQGYAELYFKKPYLFDRPVSVRVGRMAYEVLDRKLFARDNWGNTGTNFQGARIIIGEKENDWQLDMFALRPMVKSSFEADKPNQNRWLYSTILNWRRWSDVVTIQPFYFKLDQEQSVSTSRSSINSPGLRFYGKFGQSNFDYDFIGIYQFGTAENQEHRAYAHATEIGYSFADSWKTRLSGIYGYASGDKNPNDNKNQRFERLYGFNRPWSNSNHIEWENLEAAKSRVEFQPHKLLKMEASYSYYWLASSTDNFARANLRDKTGNSGREIGRDFDFRAHYQVNNKLKTTLGFAHFIPGKFTKKVGRDESSDFVYLELNYDFFSY